MGNSRLVDLLAAFLAAGAIASAQTAAPPDEKLAGVEGIVAHSVTGTPLARVQVHLTPAAKDAKEDFAASTGPDGKFSIAGIPKGTYTVTAKRPGFVMPAGRDGRRAFDIVLQPGDKKDDVAVKLTPTGAIAGRVTGVEGVPIEGANVQADNGAGELAASTTDEKGVFRIGGLAPGKYRVLAGPEFVPFQPEIRTDQTEQIHYSPTYFPAALEPAGATRVEVRPDSESAGVAIRLVRTPVVFVRGVIVGMPRFANTSLQIDRNGRSIVAGVKQDGTFQTWNLDPGKYRVFANATIAGQRLRTTMADFEVANANVEGIELRLMAPATISGKFDYEDERAKPPATAQAVQLLAATPGTQPPPAEVHSDAFELTNVLPGLYRVSVSWPGVYIRSLRFGSSTTDGALLDLRNGVGAASLAVLVSSSVGEISGIVSDASGPVANARVVLSAEDRETGPPAAAIATADSSGNYRFPNLAPGKYRLAAIDDGDPAASRGMLDDYRDVMAEIEIHSSDKLTQNLARHTPPK